MTASRFLAALAAPFRPPFSGLAVIVWAYFAGCFLVDPDSPILRGALTDSDDYMRLAHVLDWIKGQGWFDLAQHRLNPPDGAFIHFARVAEVPLAAMILALHAAGMDWIAASTITAAVWPLMLFAGFLAVLRGLARSFVSQEWTGAAAFVALFCPQLMFQFSPGRVDHHGLAALIVAMAFMGVARLMIAPESTKAAAGAGFCLALGLTVALETLPWALLLSAWVGVWMMAKGRVAARSGVVFGASFYGFGAVFLASFRPPSGWFEADPLAYSIIYVVLAGSVAVCCAGVAVASRFGSGRLRYGVGCGLAAVLGAVFLARFPDLVVGPYGAMDKDLTALYFHFIHEAKPFLRLGPSPLLAVLHMLLPLLGLAAAVGFAVRQRADGRWLWWPVAVLNLAALALAAFYQGRYMYYACLFSIVPLTALLWRGWGWIPSVFPGRERVWARVGLVLLVGPLPALLFPALLDGTLGYKGLVLFPVQSRSASCDPSVLDSYLNGSALAEGPPRLIMNMMNDGAYLLYKTRHAVVAAPYNNAAGNLDSMRFFSTHDSAEAAQIARRHRVDLVLVCRSVPEVYRLFGRMEAGEGGADAADDDGLIRRLADGEGAAWLRRVDLPQPGNYLLYEVLPEPGENLSAMPP